MDVREKTAIETVQEWISVKDKLPEKDGQYLIFTTQYFTPDHIDEIDHKDGIEISGYCKRYGFLSENGLHAKYWRDIPQPPKGDKHMENLENPYNEYIVETEITFIKDEPKSKKEIKDLLGADHVTIKSIKTFYHDARERKSKMRKNKKTTNVGTFQNMKVKDLKNILNGLPDDMPIIIPVIDEDDTNHIYGFRYVRTAGILECDYEKDRKVLYLGSSVDKMDIANQISRSGRDVSVNEILY